MTSASLFLFGFICALAAGVVLGLIAGIVSALIGDWHEFIDWLKHGRP